ncbi:MAG: helix-turn-helix domain-containing protein [Coprobacillaceae bacterium]
MKTNTRKIGEEHMNPKEVGERIAYFRKLKKMTQTQLAESLSVTNKAISKWETGAGLPDISLLLSLATILDTTVDNLLSGIDMEEQNEYPFTIDLHDTKNWKITFIEILMRTKRLTIYFIVLIGLALMGYIFKTLKTTLYLSNAVNFSTNTISMIFFLILAVTIGISLLYVRNTHKKNYLQKIGYALKPNIIEYKGKVYEYKEINKIVEYKAYVIIRFSNESIVVYKDDIENNIVYKKIKKDSIKNMVIQCLSLFLISLVWGTTLIMEMGYMLVLKSRGYEFMFGSMEIGFIFLLIVSSIGIWLCNTKYYKERNYKIGLGISFIMSFSIIFIMQATSSYKTTVSYSPDFSSCLVIKQDKETLETTYYRNSFGFFIKPENYSSDKNIVDYKLDWTANDVCVVTLFTTEGSYDVYVGTYGERGNGISYNYVFNMISGYWQLVDENEDTYEILVGGSSSSITITKNDEKEEFYAEFIEQFGTLALALYDSEGTPRYTISLNNDFKVDNYDFMVKGSTITLKEIGEEQNNGLSFSSINLDEEWDLGDITEKRNSEESKDIINEMQKIIDENPDLINIQPTYTMFALETDDTDMYIITKQALNEYLFANDIGYYDHDIQITDITIMAGTKEEFYVELNTKELYTKRQTEERTNEQPEEVTTSYRFRIRKTNDKYLVAFIRYDLDGKLDLKEIIDPEIKQTQNLEEFFLTNKEKTE